MHRIHPLVAILFGVLILAFPSLLIYLVGFYLILTGLMGLGVLPRRALWNRRI